jgi:hypothetical protein
MPEGASPASFSVVERRTPAHRRSSAPMGDLRAITPSPALLVLEISIGDPPNLVKPGGPLRPWIGDPLFRGAPLRGGGGGWIPAAEQERGARGALARSRGECLPRGGGRGTLERRSGVVSQKLLQGARVAGLQRVFRASPLYRHPLKTWPPRGEASRAVAARPAARAYRWLPHGLTEGAENTQGRHCGQRDAIPLQGS